MKLISAVIFCAFAVAALAAENKYTNKYDNVDVDKILNNDRVLTNYIKCLMDEGPCTSEGRELKSEYRICTSWILHFGCLHKLCYETRDFSRNNAHNGI
jgi:hypothetical protein